MKAKDLTDRVFGYLTAIKYIGNKGSRRLWKCRCICSNELAVVSSDLLGGHTKSCGCYRKKVVGEQFTKHGLSDHRQKMSGYRCWTNMKNRCLNTKTKMYETYGAKGIKVCDRWVDSFDNFHSDMGDRPSLKHSLDRYPNKNGNYEPSNCRWATAKEQCRNTNKNVMIEIDGVSMCVSEWAEKYNIRPGVIHVRMSRGMDGKKSVITPLKKRV